MRTLAIAALALATLAGAAQAQQWPAKPVRVIVNVAPGGVADMTMRVLGARLTRAMKTFQLRLAGEKRFWTHTNASIQYNRLPNVGQAHNSASLSSVPWPQGRTKGDPLEPCGVGAVGTAHYTHVGKWTRYFQLLEVGLPATDPRWDAWKSLSPACTALAGTWTALSCWLADEDRDPVRIHYRVPVSYFDLNGIGRGVGQFEYEFNTSTSEPALTGQLIGYGRNVVVLKNYPLPARPEDDTCIFQRPTP